MTSLTLNARYSIDCNCVKATGLDVPRDHCLGVVPLTVSGVQRDTPGVGRRNEVLHTGTRCSKHSIK